jgi:hypothetical protein
MLLANMTVEQRRRDATVSWCRHFLHNVLKA